MMGDRFLQQPVEHDIGGKHRCLIVLIKVVRRVSEHHRVQNTQQTWSGETWKMKNSDLLVQFVAAEFVRGGLDS